jgi:hypothetical protein
MMPAPNSLIPVRILKPQHDPVGNTPAVRRHGIGIFLVAITSISPSAFRPVHEP